MGNANSGRKPISEHSAKVKHKLAEIAQEGVVYLGEVAAGKRKRPSVARIAVITEAINQTIGKPRQQVDTHLTGELIIRVVYEDAGEQGADESEILAQKKALPESGGST